jgi:homoserine kinase type II
MNRAQAPELAMLWETCDPGQTLDERFGFGQAAAAGRWVADTLGKHWGVRVDWCERIVMSGGNALAWVGTGSGRLLAKWSVMPERFERLAGVARLAGWAGRRGLPVSAPVPARDGRLQVDLDGVSLGLQRVIEDDLLDVADPAEVRAAGAMLARLQEVLAAYPEAERFPAPAHTSLPLAQRVTNSLDARLGHLPAPVRTVLRDLVAGAPPDRPARQLVHFDFRSANILTAGGAVTAILDFEEAQHEHRLVELARAAVMLGTRYRRWGPVPAEVRAAFLAGYRAVRPLAADEATWLEILILWQAMAMVPAGDDPTGWGASASAIAAAAG